MKILAETAGSKPQPGPLVTGCFQVTAFSWQPILNLPTRQLMRARGVSRGWRSLRLNHPS